MALSEQNIINQIKLLRRKSPLQLNHINETDAELVMLGNQLLAITTDTVYEEISLGILTHPYTMGWFAVLASLSDIAAVGASPVGLVMNYNLPYKNLEEHFSQNLIKGVEDCVAAHNTFIFGGDTNESDQISITSTCFGNFENDKYLLRNKCKPGDKIYVTEGVGRGNLLGLLNMMKFSIAEQYEANFKPEVDFDFVKIIAQYASACIDTSDGLFSAFKVLMDVNPQIGFKIESDKIPFQKEVIAISEQQQIPKLAFALGKIGDYGLLFTIPTENEEKFLEFTAGKSYCIGQVSNEISFTVDHLHFDLQKANELLNDMKDPAAYLKTLVQLLA